MKGVIVIFLMFITLNSFCQTQFEKELKNKCATVTWMKEYEPQDFFGEKRVPFEIIKELRMQFEEKFGEKLSQKIVFTVGFEYELEVLAEFHEEYIKELKWEVPRFTLNYAFQDSKNGFIYCMSFNISDKNEIMRGFIPTIKDEYRSLDFISEETAIEQIKSRRIKKKKLKNISLENGRFVYNSVNEVFEWEFSSCIYYIRIEAIPNGKIQFGRNGGIIDCL